MPAAGMNRAVFLDRDGVINEGITDRAGPFAPKSLDQLRIYPGVPNALSRLRAAGFLLIVVTNQPDVRRGLIARGDVDAIHQYIRAHLPIDDIRVCFHDDVDRCACRKPKPGLIVAAAVDREIQLERSFMVGDRWRDIGAGKAAGCSTVLVNRFPEEASIDPDVELSDLASGADWILARS
jgi:D-glycero-D-manno-heptose 1,7-bisphosphate phosphatase